MLRKQHLILARNVNENCPVRHPKRRFDRVGHARRIGAFAANEPVNDYLDGVPLLLVQVELFAKVVDLAVDPDADEAGLASLLENVLVLALASPDHRREYLESRPVGQRENRVHDVLYRLPLDRTAAFVAVRSADPGEQEAKVVVYLGDCADGGTRVVGNALLVNRDGGGQALYVLDVGLVHASEELPGVGGQGLDVAPLPLGINGVECERTLPRTGDAGNNDQLVAREWLR